MKKNHYKYILFFGCYLCSSACVVFVNAGEIRAGYMAPADIDVLPKMAENGMNLALVKFDRLSSPMQERERQLLIKWAKACQQMGVQFMPVINLWGLVEGKWVKPRYHLFYEGVEYDNTPCPLEADVYQLLIHNRLIELARLSQEVAIAGAVVDIEMYGANITTFPGLCLCDYCFEKFLAGRAVSEPLSPDKRQDYLVRTNQIQAYRAFTSNYIEQLARQTKQQVEIIAPQFLIGALQIDIDNSYYNGLAKGLGSGNNAVLVFTENTYSMGYNPYINETQKRFRNSGTNARLVVGIWQDKFPVDNLSEQYYCCAKDSAGYWVYEIESLAKNSDGLMPFPVNQYWQAIRKANDELDKSAANPEYKSFLKIRPFVAPEDTINPKSLIAPPIAYVIPFVKPVKAGNVLKFRHSNRLVFLAQKGDSIEFEASFQKANQQYPRDYAVLILATRGGDVLAKDKATVNRNGHLDVIAPYTGSYVIALEPDNQIITLLKYSHPYSIDVTKEAHLLQPEQPLFLWKAAGSHSANVIFGADGPGEAFVTTFKSDSGKVLGQYSIFTTQTISVPLGQNAYGEITEFDIKPRPGAYFEDVLIRVESGLEKYISPFKEGVVRHMEK